MNNNETCALNIGNTLPELKINIFQNDETDIINTNDYRGKWLVIFFYPGDFTFVCPTELEELAARYEHLTKLKGEIISISTDSVFVHKAWHEESPAIKKINFPMGSDPNGEISKLFGVYDKEEGVARRGSFVFDPDGKLVALEINDNSIGRNADELIRKIQAANYVYNHKGEVCPASWKPGDDAIKVSTEVLEEN